MRFEGFHEKVMRFGPNQVLTGILSAPYLRAAGSGSTGLVLLNAGLLHHAGPFRLWVDLARRFARQGMPVLRFDFSGLGDSLARPGGLSDEQRAMAELREAIDLLQQQTGIERVVVLGLCSGADYAHPYSLTDPRVVGLVMMDAYAYKTTRYEATHHARLVSPERWQLWARRKAFLREEAEREGEVAEKPLTYIREFPPRDRVAGELRALVGRGTRLLFLFTGGVPEYYNYKDQFAENFADVPTLDEVSGGSIELEYYDRTDHIYAAPEDRERLARRLEGWLGLSR